MANGKQIFYFASCMYFLKIKYFTCSKERTYRNKIFYFVVENFCDNISSGILFEKR